VTTETPPKIQMLVFGNGIVIPADWISIIPSDPPMAMILKPILLGVIPDQKTQEKGKP